MRESQLERASGGFRAWHADAWFKFDFNNLKFRSSQFFFHLEISHGAATHQELRVAATHSGCSLSAAVTGTVTVTVPVPVSAGPWPVLLAVGLNFKRVPSQPETATRSCRYWDQYVAASVSSPFLHA